MSGVHDFRDLICWQLATELSDLVDRMTERGPVRRDFRFRNQIRDSAASAPSNISEGWGRYYANQNAPYVRIAKASLDETLNHLLRGKRRRYFSDADFNEAFKLAKRALGATTRYLLYLESLDSDSPGRANDAVDPRARRKHARRKPKPKPNPKTRDPHEPGPDSGMSDPESDPDSEP